MKTLNRTIFPEIRVLSEPEGLVEYVASDQTLDCYREIIRADGWRFNHFAKNAPFVDSHDYSCIEKLVGAVVEFRVEGQRLIETVKWAVDVAENKLAGLGFRMTAAGYLKAVSVGFQPVRMVSRWDNGGAELAKEIFALGLDAETGKKVQAIYMEQEQLELSSCILGANPNALARAYKAGAVTDDDLGFLETISADKPKTGEGSDEGGHELDPKAVRLAWVREVQKQIFKL